MQGLVSYQTIVDGARDHPGSDILSLERGQPDIRNFANIDLAKMDLTIFFRDEANQMSPARSKCHSCVLLFPNMRNYFVRGKRFTAIVMLDDALLNATTKTEVNNKFIDTK